MLEFALPVVSVNPPRATSAPPASEPKASLPPSTRAPPEEPLTTMLPVAVNRLAEPSVSVPELRFRAVTPAVPASAELAVTVMVPVPALPATVPPPRA